MSKKDVSGVFDEHEARRQRPLLYLRLGILLINILLTGGQTVLFGTDRKHALSKLAPFG